MEALLTTGSYQAHERSSHTARDRWAIGHAHVAVVFARSRVGDTQVELVVGSGCSMTANHPRT
jgi:hypothetical protein